MRNHCTTCIISDVVINKMVGIPKEYNDMVLFEKQSIHSVKNFRTYTAYITISQYTLTTPLCVASWSVLVIWWIMFSPCLIYCVYYKMFYSLFILLCYYGVVYYGALIYEISCFCIDFFMSYTLPYPPKTVCSLTLWGSVYNIQ